MTEYRRIREPGGTYFFTVVTFNRKPILTNPRSRAILRKVWKDVQTKHPFETLAICLLPDHIHTIWRLPEGDTKYSMRWNEIKRHFTHEYVKMVDSADERNESRMKRREQAICPFRYASGVLRKQRRYWEHTFYEQDDLNTHIDYIHINPMKHALVKRVKDWPWSSFHRYVQIGTYPVDWGGQVDDSLLVMSVGE